MAELFHFRAPLEFIEATFAAFLAMYGSRPTDVTTRMIREEVQGRSLSRERVFELAARAGEAGPASAWVIGYGLLCSSDYRLLGLTTTNVLQRLPDHVSRAQVDTLFRKLRGYLSTSASLRLSIYEFVHAPQEAQAALYAQIVMYASYAVRHT